jgi:hypothetical protein
MKTLYEFFDQKKTINLEYSGGQYKASYYDRDEDKHIWEYCGQSEKEILSKIIKKFGRNLKIVWSGESNDDKKPEFFLKHNIYIPRFS